ncbi:MAG: DUF177 domain-containing protein [Saprospiraceae bacterium]|nr:DUF177 domain-containing protein [Saprospiraceae bacterium]
MDALVQYNLPVSGLHDGIHQFDFEVDSSFFEHFENALFEEADIKLRLYFDKRPSMYMLTFDFEGTVKAECDRCLEYFNLPIKGTEVLMVKFNEEPSEEGDVVYIPKGTLELNVAKYIYDYICLAFPISKVHEDAGLDCDPEMMKFLEANEEPETEDDETNQEGNPLWDALKGLNKN